MKSARSACFLSICCLLVAPAVAQNQIGGGTCSAASLNGTYSLTLSGRETNDFGGLVGTFQAEGTATFDGKSVVTFSGVVNAVQAIGAPSVPGTFQADLATFGGGAPFSYAGNYAVPSNCYGTITFITGSTASFTLVVWGGGADFSIIGADGDYVYSGSGNNVWPVACANASLSGAFSYSASGTTLSGTTSPGLVTLTGSADEAGVLQFDGQGNVTASYTQSSGGTPATALTASGTYSVTPACLATATLVDSNNRTNTLNFVITGAYGSASDVSLANPQFVRNGSAHAAYLNPTESMPNVFSYVPNYTPAGSAFVLYGTDLATKEAQAATVPFPTELATTKVTVNGEFVPLYYVSPTQINAQMPWDIPGDALATVVVQNGSATSNAAAVYVPATGTPGIDIYNTNRAVVTNSDNSVNSSTNGANVGDEVVAWFTGGGPVTASGNLVSGSPAPSGLSWLATNNYSVTVGTAQATVDYIGLTPGSIGLYQANFVVPSLAKGTYPVQITIAGQSSNSPNMTVK